MQASNEVWGKIFGVIDSREKFLDHRLELAIREWARMKANDSLECRNCHSADSMDITRQSPRALAAHQTFLFAGEKTCNDCHKGIAASLAGYEKRAGVAVAARLRAITVQMTEQKLSSKNDRHSARAQSQCPPNTRVWKGSTSAWMRNSRACTSASPSTA